MKRIIIALCLITAIGAGGGAYYIRHNGSDITVNTSPVTRGDLIDTVGATGTLQAVVTVQVGSQVSGNISWLGADFNSIVHKGQVVARLEPSLFEAQVAQAKANLIKSQADVERNKVALTDAQTKYTRAKELAARNLIPPSDLDAAKIAVDEAQAMLQSSQATVEQSHASLNQAQVNLDHCVITAPIDGIVIQRSVDVGQTVAASMQAPTIFVIAADLTKMQVNANIDEADVGRIRPGQTVTFHVDAYPAEEFRGTVAQIRLQPVVVQNVTTYGTIVDVPNPDLKLKPGMTANLKVQIATRNDVVRIPNAALRFRPTNEMFVALNEPVPPEAQFAGGRGGGRGGPGAGTSLPLGRPVAKAARTPDVMGAESGSRARNHDRGGNRTADPAADASARLFQPKYGAPQSAQTIDALFAPLPPVESRGRAWLYINKQLKPVSLRLGITDGTNTELLNGDAQLQPGMDLVTSVLLGSARSTAAGPGAGNPLLPQRGGGPGRGR